MLWAPKLPVSSTHAKKRKYKLDEWHKKRHFWDLINFLASPLTPTSKQRKPWQDIPSADPGTQAR